MNNSLVSVVIPAYQSAGTLPRAVQSALNQTYLNLEIIVVDNGSTDHTREIVQDLMRGDERVHYIRLEENQRPAGGRNAGVQYSTGEYIAFLDADDEWLPGKIEEQAWALITFPEIGIVISDGSIINQNTRSQALYSVIHQKYIQRLIPKRLVPEKEIYQLVGPVRKVIYEKCIVNTSSVILRKKLFQEIGGFDMRLFGPEDMDVWVKLAKRTQYAYLASPVVNSYVSTNNVSTMSDQWLIRLLSYHKICYRSEEYADILPLVKKNIEKYYRQLIILYGQKRQVAKSWKMVAESIHYGFFPSLLVYAALSPFGKEAYNLGITMKNLIQRKN